MLPRKMVCIGGSLRVYIFAKKMSFSIIQFFAFRSTGRIVKKLVKCFILFLLTTKLWNARSDVIVFVLFLTILNFFYID